VRVVALFRRVFLTSDKPLCAGTAAAGRSDRGVLPVLFFSIILLWRGVLAVDVSCRCPQDTVARSGRFSVSCRLCGAAFPGSWVLMTVGEHQVLALAGLRCLRTVYGADSVVLARSPHGSPVFAVVDSEPGSLVEPSRCRTACRSAVWTTAREWNATWSRSRPFAAGRLRPSWHPSLELRADPTRTTVVDLIGPGWPSSGLLSYGADAASPLRAACLWGLVDHLRCVA